MRRPGRGSVIGKGCDFHAVDTRKNQRGSQATLGKRINMRTCPLCLGRFEQAPIIGSGGRQFFQCPTCWLVSANRRDYIPEAFQVQTYRRARCESERLRREAQLRLALNSLAHRLKPETKILDFGCGPEPVLPKLLEPLGAECHRYDPLFEATTFAPSYDLIAVLSAIRHFREPAREFRMVTDLLLEGGLLWIETVLWTSVENFTCWPSIGDRTKVSFYHTQTLDWICAKYGYRPLDWLAPGHYLLQKCHDAISQQSHCTAKTAAPTEVTS
jgi:uncharacterized C2H2 Zn-finger protein